MLRRLPVAVDDRSARAHDATSVAEASVLSTDVLTVQWSVRSAAAVTSCARASDGVEATGMAWR